MKPIIPVKLMGFKLYIQIFLEYLINGILFRKEKTDDKCEICGKELSERRYEISITRPKLAYTFEFDKFLCIDHAIQFLHTYKKKIGNKRN